MFKKILLFILIEVSISFSAYLLLRYSEELWSTKQFLLVFFIFIPFGLLYTLFFYRKSKIYTALLLLLFVQYISIFYKLLPIMPNINVL